MKKIALLLSALKAAGKDAQRELTEAEEATFA